MKEQLVSRINDRDVKVNVMESKIRHSIDTPEKVSQKFDIGIKKYKYTFKVTM